MGWSRCWVKNPTNHISLILHNYIFSNYRNVTKATTSDTCGKQEATTTSVATAPLTKPRATIVAAVVVLLAAVSSWSGPKNLPITRTKSTLFRAGWKGAITPEKLRTITKKTAKTRKNIPLPCPFHPVPKNESHPCLFWGHLLLQNLPEAITLREGLSVNLFLMVNSKVLYTHKKN